MKKSWPDGVCQVSQPVCPSIFVNSIRTGKALPSCHGGGGVSLALYGLIILG